MSLLAERDQSSDAGRCVFLVDIDELTLGPGPRIGPLDDENVRRLMALQDSWTPILLWGSGNIVLDGAHRVAAARRLGIAKLEACRFSGSADEAYLESLRARLQSGLPLTLAERRQAVHRVLAMHPEWSDRLIAAVCGLSDKTIGRLRRLASVPTGHGLESVDRRVGRDGKLRPLHAKELRDRIRTLLLADPAASLRLIASAVGASPETVRRVRAELLSQHVPATPSAPLTPIPAPTSPPFEERRHERAWQEDPALLTCGDSGNFAQWFDRTSVGTERHQHVWAIPYGRIYEVVDEARRRAACWTEFASVLESRART